jgi:hypothetical protein
MRRNSSSNRNAFGVLAGNSRLNGLDENVGFHHLAQNFGAIVIFIKNVGAAFRARWPLLSLGSQW